MTNNADIQQAISRYLDHEGETVQSLADKVGVSHVSVVRWRSGAIKEIKGRNWQQLQRLIAPYLRNTQEARQVATMLADGVAEGKLKLLPLENEDTVLVPVLGAAAAAGFEPAIEPLDEWLTGHGDRTVAWRSDEVGENDFVLIVEGQSMAPEFPDGTELLVAAGKIPERGDLVVARLADHGEVVVKRYQRKNGVVYLESDNPEGKSFEIDLKKEPGRLMWMWPVLHAKINLRCRRWARKSTTQRGDE